MQKRKITFLGSKKSSSTCEKWLWCCLAQINRILRSLFYYFNWEFPFLIIRTILKNAFIIFSVLVFLINHTKRLFALLSQKNCFFSVRRHDCDKAILAVPPFVNTKIANGMSSVRRIVINKNYVQSLLGTHRQEFLAYFCIIFCSKPHHFLLASQPLKPPS